MPNLRLICDYCGSKWTEYMWGHAQIAETTCKGCGHPAREFPPQDIFGHDKKSKKSAFVPKSDVFGYDEE